jgi:Beta-lactamase enzyme family
MQSEALSSALRAAVLAQQFERTPDAWAGGAAVQAHPSIDLAVAVFAPGRLRAAQVLFSREHPQGLVADIAAHGGALRGIRFDADLQSADGTSIAWLPGSDWATLPWRPLHADADANAETIAPVLAPTDTPRFVAPYPASLLKLMVAVGVGLAVDRGLCAWPDVRDAVEAMITVSSNDATDTCVALLHRTGLLGGPVNALNACFAGHGLATLQMHRTTAAGGWRNADGAGVGQIHMTAWDTVRLLWLLDAQAPPAPWLPAGTPPLLQPATRDTLRAVLARQQRDDILSSGSLRDQPGWVPGLPDAPLFAHKTGTTDTYASDAGIVHGAGWHGIVALLSSLGQRHAATPACATTWRLPALGAAVHAAILASA